MSGSGYLRIGRSAGYQKHLPPSDGRGTDYACLYALFTMVGIARQGIAGALLGLPKRFAGLSLRGSRELERSGLCLVACGTGAHCIGGGPIVLKKDRIGRDGMIGTGTTETTIGSESQDIIKVLRTSMIEHSLPLWSREGWDASRGGFVERLDVEGRADRAAHRRVRVQARQIYCFAKAADLGWYPQGREIATKGL